MSNRFCYDTKTFCEDSWELVNSNDIGQIDRYGAEALNIGGAVVNLHRLLGIHEQNSTMNIFGGEPISSTPLNDFKSINAFDKTSCKPWRSFDRGDCVIPNAFIGYDFGVERLATGRERYGVAAPIRYTISTITIQQSADELNRCTKVRVERSDDGKQWFGVAILDVPNDPLVHELSFKVTTQMRFWRIRPIAFNGKNDPNAFWEVKMLRLSAYDKTMLESIQDDYGWLENRDREYDTKPVKLKGFYDLLEKESDLTPFGFSFTGSQFYFTMNFNDVVNRLGRPVIIGDVIELPSESQYNVKLDKVLKYLEVIDVSWSAEGYAPGWQPTMIRVIAEPMLAKQETMDIVGDFAGIVDTSGLLNLDTSKYSNIATVSNDKIVQQAKTQMPQSGTDSASQYVPTQETIDKYAKYGINVAKLGVDQLALYVEDGLPKNGEHYTEGPDFPTNPKDKDYHRITYVGLAEDVPPRLYRYSGVKGRWIYLETDKRQQYDKTRPQVDKLLASKQAIAGRSKGKTK